MNDNAYQDAMDWIKANYADYAARVEAEVASLPAGADRNPYAILEKLRHKDHPDWSVDEADFESLRCNSD